MTAWKTYAYWALWVGLAFVAVYPTCNWLTARRAHVFNLYCEPELAVPFLPPLIWAYLSMYALFLTPPLFLRPAALTALGRQLIAGTLISGAIFLIFPGRLGFSRTLPTDQLYCAVFTRLYRVDAPHNTVPSLHVVFSALIALAVIDSTSSGKIRGVFLIWLTTIVASTILVHQHHFLDLAAGLLVAAVCRRIIVPGEQHA